MLVYGNDADLMENDQAVEFIDMDGGTLPGCVVDGGPNPLPITVDGFSWGQVFVLLSGQ